MGLESWDLLPSGSPSVGTTPSLSDTSLTCQSVITLQILMGIYRCESRTLKKIEHQRNDAFKLWCWRRFLRVPWTAKRSNQLILKEINPVYSLGGLMPNLKLQYFDHLMRRKKTLMTHGKDPDAGKE